MPNVLLNGVVVPYVDKVMNLGMALDPDNIKKALKQCPRVYK